MEVLKTFQEDEVHDLLAGGMTLVTVNRRLAGYAMNRYSRRQLDKGLSAWETPDILPYGPWLARCVEEIRSAAGPAGAAEDPVLLKPLQELVVWEEIIAESSSSGRLMRPRSAARAAMEAWRLCTEWRVPVDAGSPMWSGTDAAAFASWAASFENRLRRSGRIAPARLADIVREAALQKRLPPTAGVLFTGFDDFSPQHRELIEALAGHGIFTGVEAFPSRSANAVRAGFPDEDAELAAAASWARSRIQADPGSRTGIIVNGLEKKRDAVCRVFGETLRPSSQFDVRGSERDLQNPAFNISMGLPLADNPLVRSALSILDMAGDLPAMDTISELLLSPFTNGADAEGSARARADAYLRKIKQPRLSAGQVLSRMESRRAPSCPLFCRMLAAFDRFCLDLPEKQSPEAWSGTISDMTDIFGWPGDRTPDSGEYQAFGAWQDVLVRFAAAGDVVSDMSFADAAGLLRHLLDETLFQPETGDAGLQIMGLLEAGGEEFDALWIIGLNADNWPRPPAPNPFIPASLARRFDLPRATPAREAAFSGRITARLLASADTVVASWPLMSPGLSGEAGLLPSALLEYLPEADGLSALAAEEGPDYRRILHASGELETLEDLWGPPAAKGSLIGGGTGVLKAQSACPFSAFARYRLGAAPRDAPVNGIDAADRGTLVHRALEDVWRLLGDRDRLVAKTPEELTATIDSAVSGAVSAMARMRPNTFAGKLADMEADRLRELVFAWLKTDAARSFFEVEESEKRMTIDIAGIRIGTVADRIDRLANGRRVIIDYKTGSVSLTDWFSDRIAEPQLPLYCLVMEVPPAGVLFGRVKKGAMKYVGIADDETIVLGVKAVADDGSISHRFSCVADVVSCWQEALERIAKELAAGWAAVSPVSVNKSCRYCHLKSVCRIGERSASHRWEEGWKMDIYGEADAS